MRVALHDGDCGMTRFPNLALMKLSAWHKRQGDDVSWFSALEKYDRVYSSSVFTFSAKDPYLPEDAICGGTGYQRYEALAHDADTCDPDFSLYPDFTAGLGFCTRGCVRRCEWCVVPRKEGGIRFDRHIVDVACGRKSVVLMDNNFLAYDGHCDELASAATAGLRIDFNQGLDARLVDHENAKLLASSRWIRFIRFSCDTVEMIDVVRRAVEMIRAAGYGGGFFCYVLVRDVGDAYAVTEALREMRIDPFAQAYREYGGDDKRTNEQKRFCRWVNMKAVWKTVAWEDYR